MAALFHNRSLAAKPVFVSSKAELAQTGLYQRENERKEVLLGLHRPSGIHSLQLPVPLRPRCV